MKVALVHDYLYQIGGAERVVLALHELFPDAPLYTSIYNRDSMLLKFKEMNIHDIAILRILNNPRLLFLFYPLIFKNYFDLSEYDLIISSSSAYAKGVKKNPHAKHVCYCHTPMRFAWRYQDYIQDEDIGFIAKKYLPILLEPLRRWDIKTSKEVDYFVVNSDVVKERVKTCYNRDSTKIYPPVDTTIFRPEEKQEDYYLIVSRLVPYKHINVAISAFSRLGMPLKVVGDGPDLRRLKRMAGKNIEFLERIINDNKVAGYYAKCKALIQTGEEDLGLAPLEAAACGRPTIAYGKGGACETIIDGKTGLLFKEQTVESLIDAINKFEKMTFNSGEIRRHAENFSKEKFIERMSKFLHENKIL